MENDFIHSERNHTHLPHTKSINFSIFEEKKSIKPVKRAL